MFWKNCWLDLDCDDGDGDEDGDDVVMVGGGGGAMMIGLDETWVCCRIGLCDGSIEFQCFNSIWFGLDAMIPSRQLQLKCNANATLITRRNGVDRFRNESINDARSDSDNLGSFSIFKWECV
jgi:hypothetical protein